jgi:hypothetical protein
MYRLNLSNQDKRSALLWVLGGILFASWLYGSWHAFAMHGLPTALAGFLIPPYGIYLASEAKYGHPQPPKINLTTRRGQQLAISTLNNDCLINDERRQSTGLTEKQFMEFCRCAAYSTVEILQPAAEENIERDRDVLKQKIIRGEQSCWSTARYLPSR